MITKAEELARKVTQKLETGDRDVLEHLRRVVKSINGSTDPDLEQEVFLRVFEAFRIRQNVRSPAGLMRKIARDTIVDSWRARRFATCDDVDRLAEERLLETPRPEERMDRERALRLLEDSILNLGCDIRGPVYLFYVEDYSIRTIVRIFGKSPSAIKMALHRGRRQLGRMLRETRPRTTKKVEEAASFPGRRPPTD